MRNRWVIVLFAFVMLLAASSTATAQRWGQEPEPREGACFYEDPGYGGDYFCLRAGETLDSLPSRMNDRISSIRTFGNTEVRVFRDYGFEGTSARFDYDVQNLRQGNWDNRISSVEVRRADDRGQRDNGYYGRSGRAPERADRVVRRAYEDLLGREPDPEGLQTYRSRIIDDGWSESDVRDSIRRSAEYREKTSEYQDYGTTRERAQDIVRRAYLSVLNREPDPQSRGYVEKVLRDQWTQQDVERELRQSAEYRNRIR
jgi:Peptidase inhibitor family I36